MNEGSATSPLSMLIMRNACNLKADVRNQVSGYVTKQIYLMQVILNQVSREGTLAYNCEQRAR